MKEKGRYGSQKVAFRPFLLLEGEGLGVDILARGLGFFDVQTGLSHARLLSQGQCLCGAPADTDCRVSIIVIFVIHFVDFKVL